MFLLPKPIPDFLGRHFEASKVEVTPSGYVTNDSFISWAKFFVEEIKEVRGNENLWCLLVLDGHHSHTFNAQVLEILNAANILAVCLPSHSTSALQVHDVSIFGPFKKFLTSAIGQYILLQDPVIQLKQLPSILEDPWEKANSNYNIKAGFKAVGLWPLNLNWIRENEHKIKLLVFSKKEEQFERLRQKSQVDSSFSQLVRSLNHLDLAVQLPKVVQLTPRNRLARTLSLRLDHASNFPSNHRLLNSQ